jgi:hypothetical protein
MNTIGILLLASLPAIATWFAAKIHFESDALEVLTEIKNRHARTVAVAIENAYKVGYRDGQRGDVYAGDNFANKA